MDVRLLTAVAESGRAAVHEIAGRLGMDVREVAARLAALSTTGLPMVVGVECDPAGIRNALAAANAWVQQHSGGQQVHGGPSGGHSGGHPGTGPSGPQQFVPPAPPYGPPQQHGPRPAEPMNTWGPPGSAAWTRGEQSGPRDQQVVDANARTAQTPQAPPTPRTGEVGSKLDVDGPEGERITIQLVEVVDPADFLYTAAGYQLQAGDRAIVVHTELTNRSAMPFTSLPDLYLVLVAAAGSTIGKAPVSLSSRPPHRIGVPPGETAGGHTVYVLPQDTELSAVRWSPRPGDEQRSLIWDITDL